MGLLDKITGKKTAPKKASKKKEANVLDLAHDHAGHDHDHDHKHEHVVLKENTGRAHHILLTHHLSEKTNLLTTMGTYVFKVAPTANKIEVKKAVESVYDVHVVNVNIVNTKGKARRYGRSIGRTTDWKKAIVTLKSGEKISGLAEGV